MWLGTFEIAEEAARAYDEATCFLRGSNTRTNFVPTVDSCKNSSLASRINRLLSLRKDSANSKSNIVKEDGKNMLDNNHNSASFKSSSNYVSEDSNEELPIEQSPSSCTSSLCNYLYSSSSALDDDMDQTALQGQQEEDVEKEPEMSQDIHAHHGQISYHIKSSVSEEEMVNQASTDFIDPISAMEDEINGYNCFSKSVEYFWPFDFGLDIQFPVDEFPVTDDLPALSISDHHEHAARIRASCHAQPEFCQQTECLSDLIR